MELTTSNKKSIPKTRIKKGFYAAKLISVKPWTDEAGLLKESQYNGHQLILQFDIHEILPNGAPGKQIQVETTDDKGTRFVTAVSLSKFVHFEYKNKESGMFESCISKKSLVSQIFEALGWTFTTDVKLITDDFIGRWVEVLVEDYTPKHVEGKNNNNTFSIIKTISSLDVPENK